MRDYDGPIIDLQMQTYFGSTEPELPIPRELLRDAESLEAWPSYGVVSHWFGDSSEQGRISTDPQAVLAEMDKHNITQAQIPVYPETSTDVLDLIEKHRDRFFATARVNPHSGMDAVRTLDRLVTNYPFVRSVSLTPAIYYPQVPPNGKEFFPIYAKCVELDIPAMITVGFPGPRVPGWIQDPMYLEEVAWFFPDLRIIMKHGGQPWVDVCIRLMKKWPNLYWATTGYAPRRYPQEVLDYLNGRGADRVMYGGYFPLLPLSRIFSELDELEIAPDVWPKLMHDNARDVFRL